MIKITSFLIQTIEFIFKRSNNEVMSLPTTAPNNNQCADSNTNGTITLTHTGPTARSYVL
jgi:hypothetical protein